jgi:hypothetical protein
VNFFGHAVVANGICEDPAFVLGAMLPDFESMVAETANRFTHPQVVAGLRTHHATDHVFHEGLRFLGHQANARSELHAGELRTGPRRAVAHVGVELLLDAALAAAPQRTAVYTSALRAGLQYSTLSGVPLLVRAKLSTLLTSLQARATHVVPRTPSEVVSRLERIFAHRPALALRPEDLPVVNQWASQAWAPIASDAEGWLADLISSAKARLTATGTAPNGAVPNGAIHSTTAAVLPTTP